ncbi:MAG: RNA 2',3'-cyclic phosphodiesterase [Firmicutes bacterium]|nr:RNA 2',3'-cyclic phosphodiesterase [Bacillota bacterium]MDD4263283.1 RNA 2',3'-cyclic phosphodiesterase [Bacillota bacterium]MDD4693134.1 RNA 2',3'-cyclic phosphodiesterase [Bacillota bacterium]
MRLFIAVKVAYDVANEIKKWSREVNLPGKKVEAENLHFTLYFLGERFESPSQIFGYLDEALRDKKPFVLRLRGLGAFFSRTTPKVLYIKVEEGSKQLCELEKIVASSLPFYKRDKPFKPHLTVSRLKEDVNKRALEELLEQYKSKEFGSFKVDKVILFSSNLRPSGPVYKAEAQWKLVD